MPELSAVREDKLFKRRHILLTKGGILTEAEKLWLFEIELELGLA
jgi:hypothetical protein